MDRKKFFALISTSLLGAALLGAIPLNFFKSKSNSKKSNSIKVKINPNAVNREKSGKKNG
jgi:glycerol kinase